MILGERMRYVRETYGDTQAIVSNKLGIATNSYANYERGDRDPSGSFIARFADIYNVSTDYLLGRVESSDEKKFLILSENERYIIDCFRECNKQGQDRIRIYAEDMCTNDRYKKNHISGLLSKEA